MTIDAGGKVFRTMAATLLKFPKTRLANTTKAFLEATGQLKAGKKMQQKKLFLDVDPDVFRYVLSFLRVGGLILPTSDEPLRAAIVHQMKQWDLLDYAFPPESEKASEESAEHGTKEIVRLPDVCVVQMADHMQHEQSAKRHAITISFGSDGFRVRHLCKNVRSDLKTIVSSTYWQCHQTNERAMFFITTKVANGTADLMTTSLLQRVVEHTEAMGYSLQSGYVTLSPDVVHTSVRMLIHNLIFRRVRLPTLEDTEADHLVPVEEDDEAGIEYVNFEAPTVGPKPSFDPFPSVVPPRQKVTNLWKK